MYYFTKYTYKILGYYRTHLLFFDTLSIGFASPAVASERPVPTLTHEVSEDVLYFGGQVSFSIADVLVRIRSISPQYEWMVDTSPTPQDTPVNAVFGVFSQALPIVPWVTPFFVKHQGRLQMQFTNSASAPTTGGLVSLVGIRLSGPLVGDGWSYDIGFNS